MDDLHPVARLIDALRPWLQHVVIVGGWAHRLYRFHQFANQPEYLPILTRDADVAILPTAPAEADIATALKAAGFEERFSGDHRPPVSEYRLGTENQGFYAEFLAPFRGSGNKRDGSPDATVVTAGVTAQRLRHLDVLFVHPWVVALDDRVRFPLTHTADVLLPNAASFIAQKLLIRRNRTPANRRRTFCIYTTPSTCSEMTLGNSKRNGKYIFGPRCRQQQHGRLRERRSSCLPR